jgi:hypothetical protein
MDTHERCKRLVFAIQHLEQTEIAELFKLLHASKCEYTRNNNGVFVNLTWLDNAMLNRIETYVAFCNKSRNEVQRYESLCDVLNKNINDTKQGTSPEEPTDKEYPLYVDAFPRGDRKIIPNRVSSSMRFYLLKKRFSKQTQLNTSAKSDLKNEGFIL